MVQNVPLLSIGSESDCVGTRLGPDMAWPILTYSKLRHLWDNVYESICVSKYRVQKYQLHYLDRSQFMQKLVFICQLDNYPIPNTIYSAESTTGKNKYNANMDWLPFGILAYFLNIQDNEKSLWGPGHAKIWKWDKMRTTMPFKHREILLPGYC